MTKLLPRNASVPAGAIRASLILAALSMGSALHAEPRTYALPDETVHFEPGPNVEVAEANCAVCHSSDYLKMQPPRQGKAFWTAEVTKMIKVYGAPIEPADAAKIADYLAVAY